MSHPDSAAAYVASVVTLYLEMPDTPMRVSASDQWLARHFHQEGVLLETVETALLLGSLRRLIRPDDAPRLAPIRSALYLASIAPRAIALMMEIPMNVVLMAWADFIGCNVIRRCDAEHYIGLAFTNHLSGQGGMRGHLRGFHA